QIARGNACRNLLTPRLILRKHKRQRAVAPPAEVLDLTLPHDFNPTDEPHRVRPRTSSGTSATPPETFACGDVLAAGQCKRGVNPNPSGRPKSSRSRVAMKKRRERATGFSAIWTTRFSGSPPARRW